MGSPVIRATTGLLAALVLISALGAVYVKHQSRRLFTELQSLHSMRDELDVDWWRLQLEESYWSTHARIDLEARESLGMRIPQPSDVTIVNE